MIKVQQFSYAPGEHECEKASNSYLMSLVAVIAGLPIPIINLMATLFFYLGNRRGTYFVRWHCTQALLSQLTLVIVNSILFWWTISIVLDKEVVSNLYIAYLMTVVMCNVSEFIATVYTAIQTRKGIHVEWYFYGQLTTILCRA
ncbi:hypothetical protein [Lutimonas sp.]|uniref:hypothetical protein n=1 Tax=Lutimonas sp. TaxID=1872403 RepID=UPI003D9B2B0A